MDVQPKSTAADEPFDRRGENALGAFLRAQRAHVTPDAAGIVSYGRRRVPGLRREELAQLAGVSSSYYTRLEQGEAMNPSPEILAALATALCLDHDAADYLRSIARNGQNVSHETQRLHGERGMSFTFDKIVDLMPTCAAMTLSHTNDVLSYTPLARELFFTHLDHSNGQIWNTHRLLFTDSFTRNLYRDWFGEAILAVASLRFHAACQPGNPAIGELVNELSAGSADFSKLWEAHPVTRCTRGHKYLLHPVYGRIDMEYQILHAPDGDGRRILIHEIVDAEDSSLPM